MKNELFDRHPRDKDLPDRSFRLDMFTKVLHGSIYDILEYAFNQETKGQGPGGEYIPVRERRPCIRYPLPKIVVDDSVSLLFSEAHFPIVQASDNKDVEQQLHDLIRCAGLNTVMIDAATQGSVGSIALKMMITKSGKVHVTVMPTKFLTPEWDPEEPDELVKVTEKYKVKGSDLVAAGYTGIEEAEAYWFQREWDQQAETWYQPWAVAKQVKDFKPQIDEAPGRTTKHGLGFVPIIWIKNLPGGDEIDGACTFKHAIETTIEIDYQLSQAARGLRYSSDPTLMIKESAGGGDGGAPLVKSAGKALIVAQDGDAKMLEINGTAANAVVEFVRALRELALEAIHGNRANADKISAAQSGRALELLYQAVIWLADRLRISYGEKGLLCLLRMVVAASQKRDILIDGRKIKFAADIALSLKWPAYIEPSEQDMLVTAQGLQVLVDNLLISRQTATRHVAGELDIEDPDEEVKQIDLERAADAQRELDKLEATQAITTPHEKPAGAA